MDKTKLIKNIVGKKLKTFGFDYLKKDGQCWIFYREVNGIKRYYEPEKDVVEQYFIIQEHRFMDALTARLATDAYGKESYYPLKGIDEYGIGEWLDYVDEESFCYKLNLIVNLFEKEGLAMLDSISMEESIIPTKEMADILFLNHKELDKEFIDEFNVDINSGDKENVDKWLKLIKGLICDSKDCSYEEVKELLVKIAAFLGERGCEILSQRWIFPPHFKVPSVVGGDPYHSFSVLSVVIDIWKGSTRSLLLLEDELRVMKQNV